VAVGGKYLSPDALEAMGRPAPVKVAAGSG
jgi:hypothetical protein